jgi:CHAD domain-containing protein
MRPAEPLLASEPVRTIARDILKRHRKRLKKRGHRLASLGDHARHKARIEAKKLRYAAEFFASLWTSKKAKARHDRFLEALEKLQNRLGELNDRATAVGLLERYGIEMPAPDQSDKKLLGKAAKAYDQLMDIKPFWG